MTDITNILQQAMAYCLLVLVGLAILTWRETYRRRLNLPPGPCGEFLLGHLRVIPKSGTAEAYAHWGREYSWWFPSLRPPASRISSQMK